jgi:Tfp pilus assembly protein PilO
MEAQLNRFFIFLAGLDMIKILGIGALVAVLYFFVIFDNGQSLKTQIEQLETQAATTQTEIKTVKDALANADRFEREVKDTVEQFTHITDFMPEKLTTAGLVTTLSELTTKAGLKLTKTEPKSGSERVDFYEITKVAFAVEGSFTQLMSFLSGISKAQQILTIDGLKIEVAQNSADPESPRIVAEGVLFGYRYLNTNPLATPNKAGAAKPGETPPAGAPNVQK